MIVVNPFICLDIPWKEQNTQTNPPNSVFCSQPNQSTLQPTRHLSVGGEDVGVTLVEDGHGGAAEELTAGGTELNLSSKSY
jgi:hypothetical protein